MMTNAKTAVSDTLNYTDVGLLLHVFTDGSFDPKSKTGGWAFAVFRESNQVFTTFGGEARTANNAMELLAILMVSAWLADNLAGEEAVIYSDSAYALNGCIRWRHIWRSNKWPKRMPNGKGRSRSVQGAAHWQAIDTLLNQNPNIKIEWCRGHAGVVGNEVADGLAERGRLFGGG